jgi:hypothetical protein
MGRCQEAGRRKKNLHNTVSPISNEVVLLDENIRIYLREIQRFHGNALECIISRILLSVSYSYRVEPVEKFGQCLKHRPNFFLLSCYKKYSILSIVTQMRLKFIF